MLNKIVCPVSSEQVDSNVGRLTVFLNAVFLIVFLFTFKMIPLYVVIIDSGIRAAGYNNYSPLCILASFISKFLHLNRKMVGKSQKIFASRLGFICAVLGMIFITFNLPVASFAIISMFAVLALLDSVFNLCVGCLIYNYFVFPFFNKVRNI